jgi:hypothetical protein
VNAIPLFVLVVIFLGCTRKPFEKQQAAPCGFSNRCYANLKNVSTNRKKGIQIQKRIMPRINQQFSKALGKSKLVVFSSLKK